MAPEAARAELPPEDPPLKILVLAAEMVPFVRTGGLADVIGALPKALQSLGHDVRVAMPRYRVIDPAMVPMTELLAPYPVPLDEGVEQAALRMTSVAAGTGQLPVLLVEHAPYFDRDGLYMYEDDAARFIFFCRAVLEGVRLLGWRPDIIHCHDWHTAIVPNWLKTIYRDDPFFAKVATVYTFHNLAFQGIFGHRVLEIAQLSEYGYLTLPDAGALTNMVDLMSRGIYFADLITTVSPTYAREVLLPEFGEGLSALLQARAGDLVGVLNGIDTEHHDPATDPNLVAHYTVTDLSGKAVCKAALQQTLGLAVQPDLPLIGAIMRLSEQKGFDLLLGAIEPLLQAGLVQIVVMGTGQQRYHERLEELRARFPSLVAAVFSFRSTLRHQIYAGADMLTMPSKVEPCGMDQMIAMRYGAIPVVRQTGGLADTVSDYEPQLGIGRGVTFLEPSAAALEAALGRAVTLYHSAAWADLTHAAMIADNSWAASARQYVALYQRAITTAQRDE